jgi:hypothetical protein
MSLEIKVNEVVEVLIGDEWYSVDGRSFYIDEYEYIAASKLKSDKPKRLLSCGAEVDAGVPAMGFRFRNDGCWLYGPITAIQAVKTVKG